MSVSVEIGSSLELGESEMAKWRAWQYMTPGLATPFLSPEFVRAKAEHLEHQYLAILHNGPEIVGFAPYEKSNRKVGVIRGVVADPRGEWTVQHLLKGMGLDVLEYSDLVHEQRGAFVPHGELLHSVGTVDLSVGWEDWMKKKSSSSRVKRFLRKDRNIERDLGDVEFLHRDTSHASLEQLLKWKSDHFERTGHFNRFSNPRYREMIHSMLDQPPTDAFGMYLSTYRAGGRMLALQLDMVSNRFCGAWQTTHDPDPELNKYSAGMVMMFRLYESFARMNVHTIDLGVGHSVYKDVMKDYDQMVVEGWSDRPSLTAYGRRVRKAPSRYATHLGQKHPQLNDIARKLRYRAFGMKHQLRETFIRQSSSPRRT